MAISLEILCMELCCCVIYPPVNDWTNVLFLRRPFIAVLAALQSLALLLACAVTNNGADAARVA